MGSLRFMLGVPLFGLPERIRLDQEKSFLVDFFRSAGEIQGILLQFS